MGIFSKLKQMVTPDSNKHQNQEVIEFDVQNEKNEINAHSKKSHSTNLDKQNQINSLTPREYDVYLLLLEGYTLKECAIQLLIKYSTANTHMTGIYKKLNVNSRPALIINYQNVFRVKN